MILVAAEGLTNDEIAKRLDTRREVVSVWKKRFFAQRLQGIDERPVLAGPECPPADALMQLGDLAGELPAKPRPSPERANFRIPLRHTHCTQV